MDLFPSDAREDLPDPGATRHSPRSITVQPNILYGTKLPEDIQQEITNLLLPGYSAKNNHVHVDAP